MLHTILLSKQRKALLIPVRKRAKLRSYSSGLFSYYI